MKKKFQSSITKNNDNGQPAAGMQSSHWWAADDTDIWPKLQITAWQQPYRVLSSYSQPHYRGPIPHQSVLDL